MPKVQLELEVVTTGEGQILRVAQQTEQAMARLKAAGSMALVRPDAVQSVAGLRTETAALAAQVGQLGNPYAQAARQLERHAAGSRAAAIGERDWKQAVGATAMLLGAANPTLALAGLELQKFGSALARVSPLAKAAALAVVGIGAAVGIAAARSQQIAQVETRLAGIRRMGRGLDVEGLASARGESTLELEAIARQRQSVFGRLALFAGAIPRMLTGGTSREGELLREQVGIDEAMREAVRHAAQVTAADQAERLARGRVDRRKTLLDSLLDTGAAGMQTVALHTGQMADDARAGAAAAEASLDLQQTRELGAARARGAATAELALIQQRYRDRRTLIRQAELDELDAVERIRTDAVRRLAAQELATQTAVLTQASAQRVAEAERVAALETTRREADLAVRMAAVQGGELAIARLKAEAERQSLQAGLDAARSASGQRVAEAERLHAGLLALLQGQLAQGLVSERDYATAVRQLDQELFTARQQSLSQYGQALTAALGKAAADYQRYADRVRDLDRQMRAAQAGTEDLLAEIRQAGMTPGEAFADRERRAQEKLAAAQTLSGDAQVAALQAVQAEYKALALEAARAGQAQQRFDGLTAKAAGSAQEAAPLTWADYQTTPGQHSRAFAEWWKVTPGAPGSREWWAWDARRGAMPTGWTPETDRPADPGAQERQVRVQALLDKVKAVGDQIQTSYGAAKRQAQGAADAAQRIWEGTRATVLELQDATHAATALTDALGAAATAAARLASARAAAGVPMTIGGATPVGAGGEGGSADPWNAPDAPGGTYVVAPRDAGDRVETAIWDRGDIPAAETGAGWSGYAAGGVVPGPLGVARPAIVHGGEAVFTPEQLSALGRAIAGAGGAAPAGGPVTLHVVLDGRVLGRAMAPSIAELVRAGQLQVTAQ